MKLFHNKFILYFLKNHRPWCILPSASKIFERIMKGKLIILARYFSRYLCGCRGYLVRVSIDTINWKTEIIFRLKKLLWSHLNGPLQRGRYYNYLLLSCMAMNFVKGRIHSQSISWNTNLTITSQCILQHYKL